MPFNELVGRAGGVEFWHKAAIGSKVGVTSGVTVTVPLAGSETQAVLVFVIITLYNPAKLVVKLETSPGLATPEGTVQACEYLPAWDGVAVTVADVPSHMIEEFTVTVVSTLTVTLVMQVEILPHASSTDHVIVDTPALNLPLASFPEPSLVVVPVIWKRTVKDPPQLSEAFNKGISYLLFGTSQND